MSYTFISYSSENAKKAEQIRQSLNNNEISTWMAPYDVPAGCRYAEAITDAIENSDCFCLLLSKASQDSDQVDSEVSLAKKYKIPFVIVQIEEMTINKAFEYYVANKHIEKVFDISLRSPEFQKILISIKKHTKADNLHSSPQTLTADVTQKNISVQRETTSASNASIPVQPVSYHSKTSTKNISTAPIKSAAPIKIKESKKELSFSVCKDLRSQDPDSTLFQIPNTFTSISEHALEALYVDHLYIPSSIEYIHKNCFSECSWRFKKITLSKSNPHYAIIPDGFININNGEIVKVAHLIKIQYGK